MKYKIKKWMWMFILSAMMLQVLYSCKRQMFPYSKAKKKQLTFWKKTLGEGKTQVKTYWVDLADKKWDWFKKYYNTELSDKDVPSMNLVPIPIYTIDSVSLYGAKTKSSIIQSMALDTNNALYLVQKDSTFVAAVYSTYQSNQWQNGGGYSGIFTSVAQKFSSLYSSGISFYSIDVYPYSKSRDHLSFNVYDNGKDLISIKANGKEVLFVDELTKLKQDIAKYK